MMTMQSNGNGGPGDHVVTGRVLSVNDKGLKLEGASEWLNVSKYAVGVVLPERGEQVTCTLDKSGFLRAVAPSKASEGTMTQNGAVRPSSEQRDRTITRLAVLKAAAEFGAARPSLKSGEILAIAASWERWVMREQDTTVDLTDAF